MIYTNTGVKLEYVNQEICQNLNCPHIFAFPTIISRCFNCYSLNRVALLKVGPNVVKFFISFLMEFNFTQM